MCGIAGIHYTDSLRSVDQSLLRAMTDEIRHRGPDDEGYHIDRNVGLGFRRLSIIDPSPAGHQPMSNEDGSIWIIFNGEFYGFQSYRNALLAKGHQFRSRTDTETILHLYEDEGIECLSKIDGMFAFALWDGRTQELFLVRDRLGIKPLFYYIDEQRLLFGSEIKAILRDPSVPRSVDWEGLHHYLSFLSVPAPFTIFDKIRKLLPGTFLKISGSSHRLVRYWDIPSSLQPVSESQAADAVASLLGDAVASQLISDVPLGSFLSGGIDSSAVVAMMAKAKPKELKTFSISFPGLGEHDESRYAQQVSRLFQTEHHEFAVTPNLIDILPKLVWHFDEPFAVSSAFATYFLASMTRQHVTVALTGDGGDELFAGYPFRYSMDRRFGRVGWIPQVLRRGFAEAAGLLPPVGPTPLRAFLAKSRTYASYFTGDSDDAFFRSLSFFQEGDKSELFLRPHSVPLSIDILRRHYAAAPRTDAINRRLYADLKTTLVDEMLTKVDRMTMASSLEARVPLLDHRLVEFVATMPGSMKIKGKNGKILLKSALEGVLPAGILHRKKHGFNVPMDRWLRSELFEYMTDLLSEETIRRRGFFNPGVVHRLISDHKEFRANNVGQLYALLNFELWYRMFMDSGGKGSSGKS